jgi:pimeloyl-ACP methyl ester carboxylesterase
VTAQRLEVAGGSIVYDDDGGDGPLVVMVPGAGDLRSEYRFVAPVLSTAGYRVVTTDLRGHGDSSAHWPTYGVAESAHDLIALLERLDTGPATVVGTSFAPAAALWAAADRPDLIGRLVLISAHVESAPAWQRIPLDLLLRGPLAGSLWASQFRKWHPAAPPADLREHSSALAAMLGDPLRRRAVRETLIAHRHGLDDRMGRVRVPTIVVMGGGDSHFRDPAAEGEAIAARTGGTLHVVADAGHYLHVEFPDQVGTLIVDFLRAA